MKYNLFLLGISFVAIAQQQEVTIDQDHFPEVIRLHLEDTNLAQAFAHMSAHLGFLTMPRDQQQDLCPSPIFDTNAKANQQKLKAEADKAQLTAEQLRAKAQAFKKANL